MLKKCKNHLHDVNEDYWTHLCFAACFGFRLIGAGMAVILHAIFPAVFQRTGSAMVIALHDELRQRTAKTQPHE